MKRFTVATALAVLIGVPSGWVLAMLLTPAFWHLEPILHMELAGHSGPSDWICYLVILIPLLSASSGTCLARKPAKHRIEWDLSGRQIE